MKSSIAAISLFVIMVIFMIFSLNFLKIADAKLDYSSKEIKNALDANSFEKADKFLNRFTDDWNKYSNRMSVFTNHNEIDDISIELSKLNEHIKFRNREESLASINSIISIIESISTMEKLNIQNIF